MKKRKLYLLVAIVCAIAAIIFLYFAMQSLGRFDDGLESGLETYTQETEAETEQESGDTAEEETLETETESVSDYESPINWETLWETSTDIYAWLDIPDTDISYALVQNAEDDTFYLTHAEDGTYSTSGALFSEHKYNGTDLTDPVTLIYGHHLRSGLYFGNLQAYYSDSESFEEHSEIVIYMPDKELHYEVFAAVPYSNAHIMYYYDFTDEDEFQTFLDEIYAIRTIGANFSDDPATIEDHIVILSTCLSGDRTQRYLVLMKLVETID